MAKAVTLDPRSRDFFRLVRDAAFANPFSPERKELNRRIYGLDGDDDRELWGKAVSTVISRVAKLEAEGKADYRLYSGKDRDLMRSVLLSDVYHRFCGDFDALIMRHVEKDDEIHPVPFAGKALSRLRKMGFTGEESLQYFGFFYQIRRAFYFINHGLVGRCPSMEKLRCRLWDNIFTHDIRWFEHFLWNRMEDFSTLLLGETGTGKGSAGAAIGRSGFIPFDEKKGLFTESFTQNLISINLSQFPESLIESELFGHKKGAFTGAVDNHQGVFSRCTTHGTIFLDEIGEVSVPVQIKLLQVLQERTFSPVGDHKKHRFHGRVMAATNRSLDDLRRQGTFRDDFFYRICSDIITIPPLRQRLQEDPQELDILLDHTIRRIMGQPVPELRESVKDILDREAGRAYHWPGNVRELEQAVRRIILTRHYAGERKEVPAVSLDGICAGIDDETLDADSLLSAYCAVLYARHGTYEEVARISSLDRRTVKKYIQSAEEKSRR